MPAKEAIFDKIFADISVTPDFNGLPASVYHGLVQLTNNAAAIPTLVAGLGLTVSLIGLVIASSLPTASWASAPRVESPSAFSVALMYVGGRRRTTPATSSGRRDVATTARKRRRSSTPSPSRR